MYLIFNYIVKNIIDKDEERGAFAPLFFYTFFINCDKEFDSNFDSN